MVITAVAFGEGGIDGKVEEYERSVWRIGKYGGGFLISSKNPSSPGSDNDHSSMYVLILAGP